MASDEPTAVERERQLAVLRGRMAKAARRKDMGRYAELKAEHAELKEKHIALSHAEVKAAMRARRVRERVQEAAVEPQRWKRPRGFGVSPLAAQRAREGRPVGAPQIPVGGLRPWRRGSPMPERVWRP
jgi:hypothetical protein